MTGQPKELPCDRGVSRTIDEWEYAGCGPRWRVVSHCGVVQLYAGGRCLAAMPPNVARSFGRDLLTALGEAATSVDRAKAGGVR